MDRFIHLGLAAAMQAVRDSGLPTGDALGDTFASIEAWGLSFFADTFTGSAGSEVVTGNDGADVINGVGGDDELHGGNDSDTISGGAGIDDLFGDDGGDTLNGGDDNDNLFGGEADDNLTGGAGADAIDGGNGVDTASYASATGGVQILLQLNSHTGDAAGDTFANIEIFTLTGFGDTFNGLGAADLENPLDAAQPGRRADRRPAR